MRHLLMVTGWTMLMIACSSTGRPLKETANVNDESANKPDFNSYWYQGKAELTSYKLEQARYGEIHEGQAVMVYVTEDFSRVKQVKLDFPGGAGDDAVKILKLNALRKFNTGIYDYSVMQSTFTPVDRKQYPNSLKVTSSSQEWCGQTFTQLNLTNEGYQAQMNSYFESEGDEVKALPKVWLENELWNLIRIDPFALPTGSIEVIPDLVFQRFKHVELKASRATASVTKEGEMSTYTVQYPEYGRTLKITFESDFPHAIESWEEVQQRGSSQLTTKATRIKSMMSAYWGQNSVSDGYLRKELGLD